MTIINQALWDAAPDDVKHYALRSFSGPIARMLVKFPDDHPKHPGYRLTWLGGYHGSENVATNLDTWIGAVS